MQTRTIKVAVHCRRRLFRDALAAWLEQRGRFTIVGQVADLAELPRLCLLRGPDLVLVDAGAAVPAALEPLREVRARFGRTRIVLVYDELSPDDLAAAQRAGVDTLIPCSLGLEALLVVLRRHAKALRGEPADGALDGRGLTEREREILALLGVGHPVRRVAALLGTSGSAVESGKRRIYAKLGVANLSQAMSRAAALGLVDRPEPIAPAQPGEADGCLPELTAREADILRSIALGHTVRQTAHLLSIAEKTVENTQARLFLKLGTHNRAGTIGAAHGLGLLDLVSDGGQTRSR